jgi:hypothetical protein
MASPDVFSIAAGTRIAYGGRAAPGVGAPAWASSLVADQWITPPGAVAFRTWANANIPTGAYQGTNPLSAMLEAFCDPANNEADGEQYIYGGGHGDGTCNAVTRFSLATLGFQLVGQPTPPSKYPPLYVNGGSIQPGPITYPSGALGNGFFRDDLTDPADLAYNTPRARVSSHMYAAACYCSKNKKTYYFYRTYSKFDCVSGTWDNTGGFAFGPQLAAINVNYDAAIPLQQGTWSIYDAVTERFYLSFNAGDDGGGWRSGVLVVTTDEVVDNVYDTVASTYGHVHPSTNFCVVGRNLYAFVHSPSDLRIMNEGFIFNMDARTMKKFVLVGDTTGSAWSSLVNQETIPSWYDGRMIRRWNFDPAEKGNVYSVNLTPESGTGAIADPYMLRQTGRTVANPPSGTTSVYKRLMYNAAADCVVLLPNATTAPVALKLS